MVNVYPTVNLLQAHWVLLGVKFLSQETPIKYFDTDLVSVVKLSEKVPLLLMSLHMYFNCFPCFYCYIFHCPHQLSFGHLSDLRDAVEEVLPTLKQQGIRVFILGEDCDLEGTESLSDKIQQASDQPLSPHLRANINIKSPALYIYTSGTTGNQFYVTFTLICTLSFSVQALSDRSRTIKNGLMVVS